MAKNDIFSIRQVVELTGLTEFTIRGWETRYSAFAPRRSDTGRREYNKSDIERALLFRELLKRGHKIGQIANFNNQKLQKLFEQTEDLTTRSGTEHRPELIAHAMELMALQKWAELKSLFKNSSAPNTPQLVHEFFLPIVQALTSNVEAGVVSISQEHIFSSLLKEKIYAVLSELENKKGSRLKNKKNQFVLATPEGDHHDIGLLLAQLLIRSYGFVSLYLGPHTPARDLSETALRFEASHLLIVSTASKKGGAQQELLSYVNEVQKKIGSHLQILIAGRQAPGLINDPQSSLNSIANFYELENCLQTLGGQL